MVYTKHTGPFVNMTITLARTGIPAPFEVAGIFVLRVRFDKSWRENVASLYATRHTALPWRYLSGTLKRTDTSPLGHVRQSGRYEERAARISSVKVPQRTMGGQRVATRHFLEIIVWPCSAALRPSPGRGRTVHTRLVARYTPMCAGNCSVLGIQSGRNSLT